MANKELIDYIKSVKEKGYADDAIKAHLAKYNYNKDIIEEAFLALADEKTAQPQKAKKPSVFIKTLVIALLVLFCSIVIFFMLNYSNSSSVCEGTSVEIYKINDEPVICMYSDKTKIQMILLNNGLNELNGLEISINGEKGKFKDNIDSLNLPENDVFTRVIDYDYEKYGDIKEVNIIPLRYDSGIKKYCSSKKISVSLLSSC